MSTDESVNANSATGAGFLRVEAEKVTTLMDLVGEIGLGVAEVTNHPSLAGLELEAFETAAHRLNMLVRELQDVASSLRLVPVGDLFKRMRRTVRDLAKQTNKKIELVLEGEDAQIDKVVVDRLYEPLVHIMRNSADHGLESPEERTAHGKPETGTITLSAVQMGGEILISIADDGRGLNRDRILAKAIEKGLVSPDDIPEDSVLWRLIFHPGFSTAEVVSNLSGRGVGMDVLNMTIKELRGRISVESTAGKGAKVILAIPLSLAFLDSMVMRVDNRLYAVPVEAVHEVLKPSAKQVKEVSANGGGNVIQVRKELITVCHLSDFYAESDESTGVTHLDDDCLLVVFNTQLGLIALSVDEILDQQQVTVKPLTGRLEGIRGGLGCAILHTGEVAIVLDVEAIAQWNSTGY